MRPPISRPIGASDKFPWTIGWRASERSGRDRKTGNAIHQLSSAISNLPPERCDCRFHLPLFLVPSQTTGNCGQEASYVVESLGRLSKNKVARTGPSSRLAPAALLRRATHPTSWNVLPFAQIMLLARDLSMKSRSCLKLQNLGVSAWSLSPRQTRSACAVSNVS